MKLEPVSVSLGVIGAYMILRMLQRAPIGTRSVLYGYHFFLIHWFFVARGWHKLYGWRRVHIGKRVTYKTPAKLLLDMGVTRIPLTRQVYTSLFDWRLWVAFMIHDLGYWGKPNMDGPEGELHPRWAGRKMQQWFGDPWGDFTQHHSRFLARLDGKQPSKLCFADKLAIVAVPDRLFLALIHLTGEVHEYMGNADRMIGKSGHQSSREWLRDVKQKAATWVEKFKDGRTDTETQTRDEFGQRPTDTKSGVWQ